MFAIPQRRECQRTIVQGQTVPLATDFNPFDLHTKTVTLPSSRLSSFSLRRTLFLFFLSFFFFVHTHIFSRPSFLCRHSCMHRERGPFSDVSRELLSRREAFYASVTISSLSFSRAFFPGPLSTHARPSCSRPIHLKTTTTTTKLEPPREQTLHNLL